MMKKLSALMMSLLLSLGAVSALANEYDDDRRDSGFAMVDKNGDGSVDKDEAKNAGISEERFDELDTNGDDRLSESEFRNRSTGGQGAGQGDSDWR